MEPYHLMGICGTGQAVATGYLWSGPRAPRAMPGTSMPTLSLTTRQVADAYWAGFLGVPADALRAGGSAAIAHGAALADYRGVFILQVEGTSVVSLPPDLMAAVAPRVPFWPPSVVSMRAALCAEIAPIRPIAVIGPLQLSYLADRVPDAAGVASVRQLAASDGVAVAALRRACAPSEWEDGGALAEGSLRFGAFTGDHQLVALAGYEVWGGRLAHLAFVTHPAHRRRGHGQAAARAAASAAVAAGLVPQWRASERNPGAMAVQRALGFVPYGFTMALHLPRI